MKNLLLLFTYGGSLEAWENHGLIDRELSYYEKMFDCGLESMTLMTYGHGVINGSIDSRFNVLPKKWFNHDLLYSFVAPIVHYRKFIQCDIMKTNQSQGAWVGWLAKVIMPGKKLVVRCGWVRTEEMMRKDECRSGFNLWWHQLVERAAFRFSDAIIVVSEIDKNYIVERYCIDKSKIVIIPNSVDTSLYRFNALSKDNKDNKDKKRILLIGRLVHMKNFQNVLKAVNNIQREIEVVIIGDGPYRPNLEKIAHVSNVEVSFMSTVANDEIPSEISKSDVIILPQLYASGMPKVILEAMAVGVPVICSNIPVHTNLINDGVNGLICDDNVESIKESILRLFDMNDNNIINLLNRARNDVEIMHDMKSNASSELELYKSLTE